jgi:hypothetical protein
MPYCSNIRLAVEHMPVYPHQRITHLDSPMSYLNLELLNKKLSSIEYELSNYSYTPQNLSLVNHCMLCHILSYYNPAQLESCNSFQSQVTVGLKLIVETYH